MFSEPFKHLIARDVFVQPFYERLVRAFQEVLDRGLSDKVDEHKFSRNMNNYDAYGIAIPEEPPFNVFCSQEIHDLIENLFEIKATGDIAGSLHTHKVGGKNGFIHNDLNPAKFPKRKANDHRAFYNPAAYDQGGRAQGPQEQTVMRAISVIYYLNNGNWQYGDGGETGLYSSLDQDPYYPTVQVPPLNNLMMAFECTPYSYHAFISNRARPRNSIIFWLHADYDETVQRWGKENFVWWDK